MKSLEYPFNPHLSIMRDLILNADKPLCCNPNTATLKTIIRYSSNYMTWTLSSLVLRMRSGIMYAMIEVCSLFLNNVSLNLVESSGLSSLHCSSKSLLRTRKES